MIGKKQRLHRIGRNGKFILIPIDHGLTMGPLKGIVNPYELINKIQNKVTGIIAHKGVWSNLDEPINCGVLVHISASTTNMKPNRKILVSNVDEAIALGSDAVSIQTNIGAESESEMLRDFGTVSNECRTKGIPLLAMMYPKGHDVKDLHDSYLLSHIVRIGFELGADIVKTSYTGDIDSFKEVTKACPIPVVIAGGEKMGNPKQILETISNSMKGGSAGIAMGRNIWENDNPLGILKAVNSIVFENYEADEAMKLL
ncbi:MAG: 2-amino-3,7-dideoxy-D-threo-hept-6-ulosonate synthase [Candidatus Ranarchaeia archaeon]